MPWAWQGLSLMALTLGVWMETPPPTHTQGLVLKGLFYLAGDISLERKPPVSHLAAGRLIVEEVESQEMTIVCLTHLCF